MKNKGFSIVEIIIVIAVIGVIAALGYVYINQSAQQNDSDQREVSTAAPEAPQITTTKDLDTAVSTVEDIDLGATDTDLSAIDSELNQF